MKKLTELAIKRPLLIVVAFVALILFGLISFKQLNYNLLPKFDANVVTVITTYRGASAEEIENAVTRNIEDAVSSMEGVDRITSSSREGVSTVTIQLKDGADVNYALNDAQRKVNQIIAALPNGIDQPILNKFSSDDIPVLRLATTAKMSPAALYDLVDKQIKPQIANIEGVGQVSLIGGNERQINVNVDKDKLDAYGLTITQVAQMVNAASLSSPAGTVETPKNQFSIKFDAKFTDPEDMRNMVIKQSANGGKVYLRDVAEVVDAQTDVTTINHFNGVPSLGVQVMKQSDANAVEVSELVRQRLDKLTTQYKNIDLKFDIASDQSTYTLASSDAVIHDLILAVFIVAVVMLLFLHSLRSSLFVLVALPASMIPVFIFMNVFGMSLNLMTLMGLSLVVGILVDDSIVILENVMRHMEMGKNKVKATVDGRSEIGFTAIAITLVDVVVFVPVALAGGIIGNILREFALVVVSSTLMSLLVCFTLTPLLAARYGKIVHLNPKSWWGKMNIWFEDRITNLRDGYTSILTWALKHKRWILGGTFVIFIASFMLLTKGFIGFSFVSKSDRGELNMKLEMAPQTAVYQNNQIVQQAEKMLFAQPEVVSVFSNVGFSSTAGFTATNGGNSNVSELTVVLVDKEKRKVSDDEFGIRMKNMIGQIPGVKVTVSPVSITGNTQVDVQLAVKGANRADMRKTAALIKNVVAKTPGTQYVKYTVDDPKPEVDVELDREKIAAYGLNASDVGTAIANAFSGNDNAKFKSNGNEYDIMVKNDKFDKTNIDDVRRLQFTNSQGKQFQLSQFAEITETMGETVMERMDRLPSVAINASVVGRSPGTVGNEIKAQVDKMQLPTGVTWQFIGNLENQSKSFGSLLGALGLGILLVYLIMVALYENAIYPLVVLFALPLAMIGAFLALALTMQDMSIFTMVGIIMLMGLVAKNGILLVDFTNHRKAEGASLVEALIDAGRERFRPILMTTIAMIVGMLPIALASGAGAEVKNGMAWVIIGGLTSSLLLTLVVVPCVYYIVDKLLHRITRRKRVRFFKKSRVALQVKHAWVE
ncbi:efflux RND transporter permease subunit [Pinibacter soli]|uniref:Efflux RND transporter permease subunit n=1 Tax=Pinibacter soli TaxID=3044211 RepID=A0ABT6RJM2_9BACT|nr:efflux RND transporter permease subunit [Pinibacter soli]MDI3322605.1 efflux RND transporter permease subunit [Pinibacter soli]